MANERKFLSGIDMVSTSIKNLPAPSASGDAVRKSYVDGLVNGAQWKAPVRVLGDANVDLDGLETIDGVLLSADDRVLLTGQTDPIENGLWVVKAGAWERPADFAAASEAANASVFVSEGTTYADTQWTCTTNGGSDVVDTDELAFEQIGASTTYTADEDTLTLSGNEFSVKDGGIGTLQLADDSVTTDKLDDGSVTDAKLASTFTKKYSQNVGDGMATSINVDHNLGTRDVTVAVYDISGGSPTYATVECDQQRTTTNRVVLTFAAAPASNAYRVVVIG